MEDVKIMNPNIIECPHCFMKNNVDETRIKYSYCGACRNRLYISTAQKMNVLGSLLRKEDEFLRDKAIYELRKIGPMAIPFLFECINGPYYRKFAAIGLIAEIAKPFAGYILPVIISKIKSTTSDIVRCDYLSILSCLGSDAKEIMLDLIDMFGKWNDPEILVDESISSVLSEICYEDEESIPLLIKSLDSNNKYVRIGICHVLEYIGKRAEKAVPVLTRLLSDKDEHVVRSAKSAIEIITDPNSYGNNPSKYSNPRSTKEMVSRFIKSPNFIP
jgi:HEAT repeat protein